MQDQQDTKALYDEYMITTMVAGFEPVTVDQAGGVEMVGEDGKRYLDCFSGISVVNCGHNHPRIVEAAKQQLDKLVHCCTYIYYSPLPARLAKRLAEITPGELQKSFFGNSGAEAVEGAIRLAKQHTGRQELVSLTHSFHGRTAATLSITGNRGRKKNSGPYMSGVAHAPAPYCYRCPFGLKPDSCDLACAQYVEEVLKYQTAGDVAAFVGEGLLGEGGILPPPTGYYETVAEIIRRDGALFIADEVQSGFGRTGKMFAIEHTDVEPDLMCMAKGIANGMPLGAFISRPEIADAFTPGDHLSTFGGNPVSCAASLATIDVLESEGLLANAAERGEQIMGRLKTFQEKCPLVGDVRGRGLMLGLELVSDKQKTPAAKQAGEVRRRCREAGVLVGVGGSLGNVIRLQPPLTITADQAEKVCDVLTSALTEVAKG
ncbi:aspartate aminotransferase family protein [Phycisphaerales bacterium AB-hyl4]|uniref:alanine--glyoxylate transaminase n=1 Tax=Natronomicrosphaera hydrolytica TaxID=3242702 RepID=A0ABV4U6M5_9BACT